MAAVERERKGSVMSVSSVATSASSEKMARQDSEGSNGLTPEKVDAGQAHVKATEEMYSKWDALTNREKKELVADDPIAAVLNKAWQRTEEDQELVKNEIASLRKEFQQVKCEKQLRSVSFDGPAGSK
jgi:hypothetical protein